MVTLVAVRLIILGIGLGVITGSLLSALDPAYQSIAATDRSSGFKPAPLDLNTQKLSSDTLAPSLPKGASTLSLSQEMTVLKQDVQALAAQQAGLTPGAFILDLDTGAYLDIAGDRVFATASMIKIPVLVAFFQDVDAGKIRLDEELVMRQDLVATEAGSMQYLPVGTKFTALETATEMIRISDNTATNMLIDRLGGIEALNERFKTWGLDYTEINDWLPDLAGTNVSTPRDFVKLMALLNQGGLLSVRSRDRCLSILRTPITDTLLPRGLGEGATIAHKTGDIGSLVGDVGLIDMPNGKRYLAAVMVERPHNDGRAQELIRQISHLTYKFLATTPPASEQSSPTLSPVDNIATEAEPDSPAIMSTYP
jgi:beta-lactamase class A